MATGRSVRAVVVTVLAAACEPAEGVRVQPLPPLERPSAEARAGLPEIAGDWRFAGWDLAPTDSAGLQRALPGLGEIRLRTQRRDSLAGAYASASGPLPLVGEVRRDSVVSLVAGAGGGAGFFLAGEVARDTLWIRTSSLVEPGAWPEDALAAYVRTAVTSTFVRLHGTTAPTPVDSAALLAADSAAAAARDSLAVAAAPPATPGAPGRAIPVPATAFAWRGARDAFGFPVRTAAPAPAPPPRIEVEPRVIGEPVRRPRPPAAGAPAIVRPPQPRDSAPVRPDTPVRPAPVRPDTPARADTTRRRPPLLGEPVRDTSAIQPSQSERESGPRG